VGFQPMSTAALRSTDKLWRSNFIVNLCTSPIADCYYRFIPADYLLHVDQHAVDRLVPALLGQRLRHGENIRPILKGQCHEMNNFFEGLKNQISIFCTCADGFYFFGFLLLSSCLLL
jgi:hypothetical protein